VTGEDGPAAGTGAELPDEVLHDLPEVPLGRIRDRELALVACPLRQDRLQASELRRALELFGGVRQPRHRLAQVIGHRLLAAVAVHDHLGIQAVAGGAPFVLPHEPGL